MTATTAAPEQAEAERAARGGRVHPAAAVRLVPLLFLVPVGAGLVASLVRLLATSHPVYGWTMTINADADAMYLGIWPFQDPAHGFTGDAYTPFYPAVVSVLNHLRLWTGWSVLLTVLSVLGLMALIGLLAYREPRRGGRERALAILEAAGIGALGVSFAFGLLRPAVYEARPDQFAWVLACFALALVPRAAGSWRLRAVVVALLTAAFWAKQTAIIGSLAAFGVVVLLVWARRLPMRTAVVWMSALAAVNVVLIAGLTWLTDGWQYRYNFGIHLPVSRSVGEIAPDLALRAAPAIAFVVIASVAALLAGGRVRPTRLRATLERASDRGVLVFGFGAMAFLGIAAGVYLRRFAGGDDNNLLPAIWGLAALGALGYRAAGARAVSAWLVAGTCVALFATTLAAGHARWALRGGNFIPDQHWADLPRGVERLAARTLVWDPILSDLNVGHQRVIYPNAMHIQEALLRNRRPSQFERALLGRRFGAIYGYVADDQELGGHPGVGWEDNYFWKLNRVIELKYRSAPGAPRLPGGEAYASVGPTEARVPVPGPDPAPWIDKCFGPFRLAGLEMQIHRGGGLWCVPAPGILSLRNTPASETEVVSATPVHRLTGRIQARLDPVAGSWWIVLDDGWVLRATVGDKANGLTLSIADAGGYVVSRVRVARSTLHASNGRLALDLRPARRFSLRPDAAGNSVQVDLKDPVAVGKLHFWATQNSRVEFNLQDLRAE